jgi:hypothetical protein
MESVSSLAEAELKAGQNKTAQALPLFQHAIELDGKLEDLQAKASDLYSYGVFLRDAGLSPRLAYACILKSQSLMQVKNTPEYNSVAMAREDLEKKLAAQAGVLRQSPDSAVREALALTLP